MQKHICYYTPTRWWPGAWRSVEDDAVNLGHRVSDARGDAGQDIVGQARPVGRHRILGTHGAQHYRVTIGTAITLNTHGTNVGKQDDRTLPDLLIQSGSRELLASNQVSGAQDIQALTRDLVILGPALKVHFLPTFTTHLYIVTLLGSQFTFRPES